MALSPLLEVQIFENQKAADVAEANAELATKKAGWAQLAQLAEVESAKAVALREAELQRAVEEKNALTQLEKLKAENLSKASVEYEIKISGRISFRTDVAFVSGTGLKDSRLKERLSSLTERLEQDMSGILTTICNHSFHCSCISKWADSSCPVCRYCQQQPEKSICFVCQTSENLWICVICGFVGCGRYEGHSIRHWKETQHCYSLELDTQRVWDYAGDNYVHRLIQSKTDGKLVELNHYCAHADDGCGSCNCSIGTGFSETLLNSKVENIVNEYSELLTTQLENQKIKAASGNQKLQKMQAKLDKCDQEKSFFDEINKSLLKNQDILKASIVEIEEREKKTLKLKDDKIRELEEQLGNLTVCLEAGNTVEQLS
ncbi:BRAP2 RING ZnF UBP domain-containing protein 2 [Camellia lanceoleosa]|uniref:BRAP2 RING ZnF UBP domain-containing protein 2 n=1 Tax=Camellia lanceoleosa TaxID=1840588 RepID=A0ACC0G1F7_9ERIC|nr:BRAP2 RING ZnF UBP domain-containing protein 2 [Camellia lanceoleosa]